MRGKPQFVTDRRDHLAGADKATFSPCRNHRYMLSRRWGHGPTLCWVMLNPSTADAFRVDQTLTKCIGFTKRAGQFGGLVVVNLYSLRSTDPKALWTRSEADRIGPLGDQFIQSQAAGRSNVIAAWGAHGARNGRGDQVAAMLADAGVTLHCLGVTKDGQPKHPLYLDGDTPFQSYRVREVAGV